MANVMLEILDDFTSYEFWWTGIQSPRFCKGFWIISWSKWILVVDIPNQILLSILWSTNHSLRCKLKVYIITQTKEKPSTKINIFRKIGKAMKVKRVSKIWVRISTTNIYLLQFKI